MSRLNESEATEKIVSANNIPVHFISTHKKVFPWFGIDIGGTLVKLVYFEPLDLTDEEQKTEGDLLKTIRHYLTTSRTYGETGIRDVQLELKSKKIGNRLGNFHFIRFPTSHMEFFIELCVSRKLHLLTFQVFATGGGAFKFESEVSQRFKINWVKCDELEMLINGIQFLNEINGDNECYYYDNIVLEKHTNEDSSDEAVGSAVAKKTTYIKKRFKISHSYPYILVNIGSGVSVLLVNGENDYKRISGTSIGGGTFLGLCCLLTGCKTYEEAIELASKGDSTKIDKLVGDIYGTDYTRFNLPATVIASSFGHMCHEEKRAQATREDLARATLVTILNNVGQIARDSAKSHKCSSVLFVGSFLRINSISKHLLAYAIHYWSNGDIKALYLEHEGYFGAVGCLKNFVQS